MYKVDFKSLKAQVGIDDVAYRLGYRIDKKAGLGRYVEMVLLDPSGKDELDKIIIKNPQDKPNQSYFKRDGRKGGDVITFIQEHLSELGQSGKNQWEAVVQVLADFSNTYIQESRKYLDKIDYKGAQVFDKTRYDVQPVDTDILRVSRFFESRGIHLDTLTAFKEKVFRIKDLHNSAYDGYNIAFPYTRPQSEEVVGYEVRGYKGFKSKAAGTDSSNAAWIADLSEDKNPFSKQYVFFMESAFDAMAFYQKNKNKIDPGNSVFVSIGGTFSENQVKAVMSHYKNALAVDCFDNDIPGKIYGLRMLAILNDAKIETSRTDDVVRVKINGTERSFSERELTPSNMAREFHLKSNVLAWKAPAKYKDWNDAILEKQMASISKYEQSQKLARQRQKLKI